ncbi:MULTISPECIES: outer membrane lipoprotein chaperone LolA [Desulfovibrio]|uniref:Outer-membrane lipoprotein carrier protein n=1 Tax=bioreactor metagenome TaxID=1076179 RepID=A0A644UTJ9_9ZZZZ|nr:MULTISPECIES: outer membrane lipoprotein chaperone LolA [Desulfovibrio]MBD8895040.1 outer membrane lipoprotein chaperone LolA [Desulfovibrio desulfuricans]MBT9748682.1 outer membrane lipoprotein chaperone LolA [Desulfovibrio desulfuricans]MCH5144763.1 outer membrane lipoprotein chaperone LolA [Desulfovibrio sp. UIB00]MEA4991120.1 outer membrane lipoprotein chaperone LolA [Desulfovibrio desulfuricans]UIA99489.1 outer membrane lipoprotein chaperone LolA [Desulfovibrio desulfuricans]
MRINGMLALAAGLVLLVASAAQAADIAATIQARYEKLRTFSATFEQTLTHKESGSVEKRQGNLLFQKPLLIRWQTDKPHEETLVVTHKEIWDYLADEEIAYRYPLELVRDSRTIIQVITGQAALTKDFDVKEAGQENGLAKLHLYPKEPAPQMVEALLWVEPSTGYIRRASIIDFYGNSNDVRFTQFKPDTSLKESDFTFTAPKGVEVEDRIDRKVQEKELFK